jgi:hypothetical protein
MGPFSCPTGGLSTPIRLFLAQISARSSLCAFHHQHGLSFPVVAAAELVLKDLQVLPEPAVAGVPELKANRASRERTLAFKVHKATLDLRAIRVLLALGSRVLKEIKGAWAYRAIRASKV